MPIDIYAGASGPGFPVDDPLYDVIVSSNAEAPRVRSADELAVRIKAANGKLTVTASSSDLIVAMNNSLRFSVTRNAAGNYEIADRLNATSLLLLAIPAVLLIVALAKR